MNFKQMTLKLISAFFILLIYIKISGRKQLAPLSPSDQISNMVIGGLVGSTIISRDVSILESIVIVSVWAGLQIILRHLKYRSGRITELIDGKRYQLMKNGLIQPGEFKEAKLSIMDFENAIHSQDIKSISEIKNAWFAPDGNISIDKKDERSQSNVLIFDGNIHEDSIKNLGIEEDELREKLRLAGYSKLDEILCLEYFKDKLYIYTKDGNKII